MLHLRTNQTAMTCPHGEEEYTLATWEPKLYTTGDVPAPGITISQVWPGQCQGPAILSSANVNPAGTSQDQGILACDCSALVLARNTSTDDSVIVCGGAAGRQKWGERPGIALAFDEPQDILSVTFQSVGSDVAEFYYTTTSDDTVQVPVTISGYGISVVLNLAEQEIQPQNVKEISWRYNQEAGFIGMKLCKGGGSLVGDPHVRTQDHAHYTVLNEGNFLAWRFNSDTDFTTKSGLKKTEVDWQIYAHYSAHRRSWTRGLLLVDTSVRSKRQSVELTSEDCKLRKHIDGKWTTMERSELVHVPEEGSFVTGFNFTRLDQKGHSIHFDSQQIWTPKGKKARWDAKLVMTTKMGLQPIATVQLRCFPGRHIDLQVIRERMGDARFVDGQLGHHGIQLKREKKLGCVNSPLLFAFCAAVQRSRNE